MPPQNAGKKWRFMVRENGSRRWVSFSHYEACYQAWLTYRNIKRAEPTEPVEVQFIEEVVDVQSLWDMAKAQQPTERRDVPAITMANAPFAIAFLSDLHIGSTATDYRSIQEDAETVRDTDGMYAVFHGDGIDNWIIGKLQAQQRNQAMPFDSELALFKAWMATLENKLIAVVAGNHDNWTKKMAGVDWLKSITPPTAIYNNNEALFELYWAKNKATVCVRHKWRGTSILNPTHGIERASKDIDADIYVGGHTHIGTLFRSFTVRNKDRLAVLTGTYKIHDDYGSELGVPRSQHRGCGAVVFDVDGSSTWVRNLQEAARYLKFKQEEHRKMEE